MEALNSPSFGSTRSRMTICKCESNAYFFFFFQAEDGIRDSSVTGVQTCALPICQFTFGYDSSHNLTSITNPTTIGGVPEQTTIGYDSSHRITSLTRLTGPQPTDLATTRLAYVSSAQTQAADPDTDQTQPVGTVPHTTYTLDAQKRVPQPPDPADHTRPAR